MADQLLRATAANGGIRIVGTITTDLVEDARKRHNLTYVGTAALGRAMSAGLLLVSSMKRAESRINLRIKGDGPLGGVMVDAGLDGAVRGYVDDPSVELPPSPNGTLNVGGAIGRNGYLYVVRDVGYGQPYSSTVELISGEIGEDLTYYLATSEQTPSALALGVFVDENGVEASGGLLLQVMPKAARDESLISLLESRVGTLSDFTPKLRSNHTLPDIFESLVGDLDLEILSEAESPDIRFYCPCTYNRMLGALKMLGTEELQDMIEKDNGAEATCHFCGKVYHADSSELAELIADINKQRSEALN
ncbi:Hsp33 family molecular chaperone HslO [Oscillatoria sp. CS-180]|uniref:Hsp33 family molecular chaperone HslO n=1 Tax=Oscillatoria sp. CS-180 TaxID=3021720 RepID=UPI00232E1735|nr:Hsp33 family molecular chaperone HslO [Oscillatoria sp. CS-180]MDB9528142.1 Hsp33 family molecular chaperone HslO [Oscillatoria sp. CS-180]